MPGDKLEDVLKQFYEEYYYAEHTGGNDAAVIRHYAKIIRGEKDKGLHDKGVGGEHVISKCTNNYYL